MKKAMKWVSGLLVGGAAFLIPLQAFAGETMGERLKFAAQNTVINIIVVFCMLVLIALIIYCFRFLPKLANLFRRKKDTGQEAKPGPEPKRSEPKSEPESKSEPAHERVKADSKTPPPPRREDVAAPPETDYTELIAVIAAAIAADEQVPVGSFVVRTIKKRA